MACMSDLKQAVVGSDNAFSEEADRGWCLCLSGGGFRATLFHLGVIHRMNELGILGKLSTISSVSGGSILNGVLAIRWSRLTYDPATGMFTNLDEEIAQPVRDFCVLCRKLEIVRTCAHFLRPEGTGEA